MSEESNSQAGYPAEVAQKIEQFLSAVDKALAEGKTGLEERANIVGDLRVQIEEMLAARGRESGKAASAADVEAVLAELDPPESYGEASPGRETEEDDHAFAGHGCDYGGRRGQHLGRHGGRRGPAGFGGPGFWGKRHVVRAFRQAMETFGPFGQRAFMGMTDRAREALSLGKGEAQRMRHDFIGTEHMLLGLMMEGTGVAAKVLGDLGMERQWAREEVERLVGIGRSQVLPRLPLTPRLRQAFEEARVEARNLRHDFIGTEHVLLGLLAVPGVAGQVISNSGLTAEQVRQEILRRIPGAEKVAAAAEKAAGTYAYWPANTIREVSIGENRYRIVAGCADTGGSSTIVEAFMKTEDGLGVRKHGREDLAMVVMEGSGQMRVGERVVELRAGDFVRVGRRTEHEARPGESGMRIMVVATPGGMEEFLKELAEAADEEARKRVAAGFEVSVEL